MKVRSDFVSNSSSSSFIIGNDAWIELFNITKQDMVDAIVELSHETLVHGRHFWVYDLFDKKDKKNAIRMWKDLLEGWTSNRLVIPEGHKPCYDRHAIRNFEKLCESLKNCYDLSYGFEDDLEDSTMFVHGAKKGKRVTPVGAYVGIPEYIKKTVARAKKKIGIVTNFDVLQYSLSRFLFHFGDNEILSIEGMTVEDIDWLKEHDAKPKNECSDWEDNEAIEARKFNFETESYSMQRFIEILYRHFIKKGKIKADDKEFLEEAYPSRSSTNTGNSLKYDTYDGATFSHNDMYDSVFTSCLHEG